MTLSHRVSKISHLLICRRSTKNTPNSPCNESFWTLKIFALGISSACRIFKQARNPPSPKQDAANIFFSGVMQHS
jgi:hypothetical protein